MTLGRFPEPNPKLKNQLEPHILLSSTLSIRPKIAILLGTYNGEEFIAQQLDSIALQEDVDWSVWASDDGSQDGTRELLKKYQQHWGADKLHLVTGPQKGAAANFLSLLQREEIVADFFAFCDQDDVWHPQKLLTAIKAIASTKNDYVLYGGRTRYIDHRGAYIGLSPVFSKPPSFANALVQSIMGGNTMVFNASTRRLLALASHQVDVVMHDWWAYQIVTGCGGKVIYDPVPRVDYRQHPNNLVGMNQGFGAKMKRLLMMAYGFFIQANDKNIRALLAVKQSLAPEALDTFNAFLRTRVASWPWVRARLLIKSGIFRQTFSGQMGLWLAIILRRF